MSDAEFAASSDSPHTALLRLETRYREALSRVLAALGPEWIVKRIRVHDVGWCEVSNRSEALPSAGWKIHVSASATEAAELCETVVSWLVQNNATFKIAADLDAIVRLNSGSAGETQTGKILTVYPGSAAECAHFAKELDRRWPTTAGPHVPSDLAVRPGGAVFLRYGTFGGQTLLDRFGNTLPAVHNATGSLVEDVRRPDGRQPDWVEPPLAGLRPAVPDISGPFEHDGELYLPLFLRHASPLGKIFVGLNLADAAKVVLKVRRRGVGTDLCVAGYQFGLFAEYSVLQKLRRFENIAPQPVAFFEDAHFVFLVMEHVDGQAFSEVDLDTQVRLLPLLAESIAQLHAAGFVHRDIKLANVVISGARVRLVDFELAAAIGTPSSSRAGTRGYMPSSAEEIASGADDVYALGVCVAHVFLAIDPGGLPARAERLVGLLRLLGYGRVAKIVRRLAHASPSLRPSAREAAQLVDRLSPTAAPSKVRSVSPAWCMRTSREAGLATRNYREPAAIGTTWTSRTAYSADGINMGGAGIILGLLSIDEACGTAEFKPDVESGADWLAGRPPNTDAHGLFTGNAGIALALAVAGKRFDRSAWIDAAYTRLTAAFEVEGDCDLFSGRAGVVYTACLLAELLKDDELLARSSRLANDLLKSATLSDDVWVWPAADPGEPSLTGAAHGSAGIALALATWGHMTHRADAVELALQTFARLFAFGRLEGGTVLRRTVGTDPSGAPVSPWCHGVAGYLWCMLLAFGDHERLRHAIDWSLDEVTRSAYVGSPVYCHGMAGELELWRLIGKFERLAGDASSRAARAASVLRLQLRRERGVSFWGAEDPEVFSPDLWVGFLGPATALALYARKIADPLLSASWLRACASSRR